MLLQLLTSAAMAAAAPGAADRCAAITLPQGAACAATTSGIVIAGDQQQAAAAASWVEAGERHFGRHFGDVLPYAVLLGKKVDAAKAAADAAGYKVVLRWPTDEEMQASRQQSLRAAMEQRFRQDGVPDAEIAARIDQALSRTSVNNVASSNVDILPHELGHLLFTHLFWPTFDGQGAHYGGPAPDWLDEAAAVMLETEAAAALKRTMFRDIWDAEPEVRDLAKFLEQDHPMRGRIPTAGGVTMERPGAPGGAPVIISSAPAGAVSRSVAVPYTAGTRTRTGVPISPASRFYAQSRAVADFLIARSGNPRILGELARGLASGQTMRQWLATNGARYNLAASPEALQPLWAQWVEQLPPSPAPQG